MDKAEEAEWTALVERVRGGETSAERELVERLYPRVARRVAGLRPRRETVEDLVQEVMMRVFQRLGQFRGGMFVAWVDTIAKRVCYDALRKQRVRPEWNFTDLGGSPPERGRVEFDPGDLDAAGVLATLFALMPPHQAWLVREVELKEKSIGEVAREMGWAAGPARLRLFRARKKLRRVYDEWKESGDE